MALNTRHGSRKRYSFRIRRVRGVRTTHCQRRVVPTPTLCTAQPPRDSTRPLLYGRLRLTVWAVMDWRKVGNKLPIVGTAADVEQSIFLPTARLAAVSVVVSFAAVRRRPVEGGSHRPDPVGRLVDRAGQTVSDLESVLGETPQGFESLILRPFSASGGPLTGSGAWRAERGWSLDAYQDWPARALADAVVENGPARSS